MKISDFDFQLPERLIAQSPAPERDGSRLMLIRRKTGEVEHRFFRDLPEILGPEHFLVLNETRVLQARLWACRPGKAEDIEVLLLRELGPSEWLALTKPGRKCPPGQELRFGGLTAQVLAAEESGGRILRFHGRSGESLRRLLESIGEPPIPPYIHRDKSQDLAEDRLRYQTVYARHPGSVAAPTAGLHFTENVLFRLRQKEVGICELLLHVGYGTFRPVRCEQIEDHRMEPEYFRISPGAASKILGYKAEGRRLVAVGTTTTRCLEFLAQGGSNWADGAQGFCNLFIYPGFQFRLLDGLLTNFHLPRSTLLMLVCAFAGRELVLDCYREAVAQGYRFYSYGDCMLLL